jgi:hypothetical protein
MAGKADLADFAGVTVRQVRRRLADVADLRAGLDSSGQLSEIVGRRGLNGHPACGT